jgi:hypothetical protein
MDHLEDKKCYFSIPGVDKKFEYTSPVIDWEGDLDDIIDGVVSVLRDLRAISLLINQFKEEQTKRTWFFSVD